MLATWGTSTGRNPTLDLQFAGATSLDNRITFSRGSQATLFDSTGALVYAKHNLLLQSQTFQTTWTVAQASVSADATTAPDGTTTADTLVENTASAEHYARQNTTQNAGSRIAFSVFVKAAGRTSIRLRILDNAAPSNGFFGSVDTSTGATASGVAGTGTITSVTASALPNGWYRLVVVGIASATATTVINDIFILPTDQNSASNYTGNGTSGVFLWGAQVNLDPMEGGVTSSLGTYYPTVASAYYAPRFDYNPSTLAAQGLLIEEQRTNLMLYSEQFDNAWWTKSGATVTADSTTAPSGTATADTLTEDTSTGQHRVYRTVSGTTNTNPYTVTFFAKANTRTRIYVGINESPTFGRNGNAVFDLSAGTVIFANTGSGGATGGSATIQNVGNGWYRCSYTLTLGGADSAIFVDFNLVSTGTTINYTGNGTSSLFIWGAQLEAGAFPTSYIPTTTTALTRNADIASMTGTNFSSWYNQSAGTFLTVYSLARPSSGSNQFTVRASDNGYNNSVAMNTNGTGFAAIATASGGVFDGVASAATPLTVNVTARVAGCYATNDLALSFNGAAVVTDTSATIPTTLTRLDIGSDHAGVNRIQGGYIQRISYYPVRLPNSTLQALTV